MVELDLTKTAGVFVAIIAIGTVGLTFTPMERTTVLMMVLPSMVVFGLIMVGLGVAYGEYRATHGAR